MVELEDKEKLKYRQFVGLLNTIRARGLLSAQQRRAYDARWRSEKNNRDLILEELERLMENYTEKMISNQEN
jgi:hypothetical protein